MSIKNLMVCKSNAVVEAGYKLSLNEQRVILACIAQVNSVNAVFVTDKFELTANDFSHIFNVSSDAAYLALTEVAESLFNRYIIIDNPYNDNPKVKALKTRWISGITYNPEERKISLRFASDMLPYLGELKKVFTRYKLDNIGKMTSIYGIRLYELLVQWQAIGKREIELSWLKKQFSISSQYKQMCDFKKRVLEPAIFDINTYSNLNVSWTQRKIGRRVSHLIFTFTEKRMNSCSSEPSLISATKTGYNVLSQVEKLLFLVLEPYRKLKTVLSLLVKYEKNNGFDYVKRNILYANSKSKGTYRGFLSASLKNDWGHDWELEQTNVTKSQAIEIWQQAGFNSEKEYNDYRYKLAMESYKKAKN